MNIEQFMRENGIRKIGFLRADDLRPTDRFSVELLGSWLGADLGIGDTIEDALAAARQNFAVKEAA